VLKNLALCAGVLFAVVANAQLSSHAKLTGRRSSGTSLICVYSGAHAKYEILAQSGVCAPFIELQ
jgi:hypothetical protein